MFYLYGLQRSGTNVISEFLQMNYNIKFSNDLVNRNSPKHKHFRIYDNKSYIPKTNVPNQYYNNYIINSLEELDILLKDTTNTNKYILVYKDIYSWLPSICKWADINKWKSRQKLDFVGDYFSFIEKWNSIKNDRVLIINYDDYLNFILNNNTYLIDNIEKFLNLKLTKKIIIPTKVNCSNDFSKYRLDYYKNKEYMNFYTKEEIEYIEKRKEEL